MWTRVFFLISILIGALAVFLTTDYFRKHRTNAKNLFNGIRISEQILALNLFGNSLDSLVGSSTSTNAKIFTKEDLKQYDGMKGSKGLYLAILGKVYDVSRGSKHYGPGGGYHFFTGKDASRAFVSGNFKPSGLIDDVSKLTPQDILGLLDWIDFYQRDYTYVGKLAGTFYTTEGKATKALHDFRADVKNAKRVQKAEKDEAAVFPPCNSEWKQNVGGRVWCSNMSGGIKRDWVGVPRLYHKPGRSNPRCACVRNHGPPTGKSASEAQTNDGDLSNPNMKEYPNCPPDADSCRTTD